MSVFPQFVQHIHDVGIYVEGYNYEAMYNIMVNNLTNNFIPTQQFIYTYAQVEDLYNLLDELLNPSNESNQSNQLNDVEIIETNETNEIYEEDEWTDDEIIAHDSVVNIYDTSQNIQYYYNIQQNQNTTILQNQTNNIYYLNNINIINMNNLNAI
jgi:hypothetical protein